MRLQPNRDYRSDDVVQTPLEMAERIVRHFKPTGVVLEPCRGEGNFLRCLPSGSPWCEIKEGRDFFDWRGRVDWIVTNPPWSQIRPFLQHAMTVAENIVFLMTVNHLWTRARVRDVRAAGHAIREICLLEMPETFPQLGFQLGAVHFARGPQGDIRFSDISVANERGDRRMRARKRQRLSAA